MKTIVKKKETTTKIKVGFEGRPTELPEIKAYVFDKKGRLLEQKPVRDGEVSLATKASQLPFHRVLIAPSRDEDANKPPVIESILHRNAYAPMIKMSSLGLFDLLPIPEFNWIDWCFGLCRVNGQVVKPIHSDGSTYNQPVCGAKVHICEVDRISLVIDRIPDYIITSFRDELLALPEISKLVIPKNPPELLDDPTRFTFGLKDPMGLRFDHVSTNGTSSRISSELSSLSIPTKADAAAVSSMLKTAIRLENHGKITTAEQRISPEEISHMAMMAKAPSKKMLSAAKLPEAVQRQFASATNPNHVRQLMVANIGLLYPYLCLAYWYWPYFYRCDELRVVETDAQGRFATNIYFQCFSDKPDLYFWVEYPIGGVDTIVYHPPIACYTYWDYDCSQEVIIKISDSRVEGCDEIPSVIGRRVDVRKIGNAGFVSKIQQTPATETIQSVSISTQGTISTNIDSTGNYPKPFGGTLGMRVDFGSDLIANGITHYRWSYRRVVVSGPADTWKILDASVERRYIEETPLTNKHVPYPLGPDPATSEILFKIPPTTAAEIPEPLPAGHTRFWMAEEFNTAKLDTLFGGADGNLSSPDSTIVDAEKAKRLLDAGLYEFKFELFEDVAIGSPKVVLMPKDDWLMPAETNPGTADSVEAADQYLILEPGNMASGFQMKVLIDNNPVVAAINDVVVDGRTSDTDCGFVAYDNRSISEAELGFLADHPNKWATFSFQTFRGNNNHQPEASASGMVMGTVNSADNPTPADGFSQGSDGVFEKSVAAADLLDTCPSSAAFAERLNVYAISTNGSHRMYHLDRGATAAFAMEPFDAVDGE